jgi:2Fe-2S ferredoxin
LHAHGVEIEHACGKVGAYTTCHVVVAQGFDSLNRVDANEEDVLDRAWGLQPHSCLSCQAVVGTTDLVVDIPRYSINHAKENA